MDIVIYLFIFSLIAKKIIIDIDRSFSKT